MFVQKRIFQQFKERRFKILEDSWKMQKKQSDISAWVILFRYTVNSLNRQTTSHRLYCRKFEISMLDIALYAISFNVTSIDNLINGFTSSTYFSLFHSNSSECHSGLVIKYWRLGEQSSMSKLWFVFPTWRFSLSIYALESVSLSLNMFGVDGAKRRMTDVNNTESHWELVILKINKISRPQMKTASCLYALQSFLFAVRNRSFLICCKVSGKLSWNDCVTVDGLLIDWQLCWWGFDVEVFGNVIDM